MKGCGDAGMKPRESASPPSPALPSPAFIAMKLQGEVDWLAKRVYGAGAHVTLYRTDGWRATVWRRLGGGHLWVKSGRERIDALEAVKRALEFLIRNDGRCTFCHRSLPLAYDGRKPCVSRQKIEKRSLTCVP